MRNSHSDILFSMIALATVIIALFPIAAADQGPPYILTFGTLGYSTDCNLDDLNDVSSYRGYELELLRDAMEIVNLTYGVDLVFQCALWGEEWKSKPVIGDNGSEAIIGSFGSFGMERILNDSNWTFSVSTKKSGLSILYVKDNSVGTKLFYFQPFSLDLYLLLLFVPLLFGLVVYIFQAREQNWFNFGYHFYLYFFKIDFLKNLKCESRLLELIFLAAMSVVVTLYTARLTDVLARQKKFGGVNTLDDLRGARIAAADFQEPFIQSFGGRTVDIPGIVDASHETIAELIRGSGCAYYLDDTGFLELLVQEYCDFQIALKNVYGFDYGIIWAERAPEEIKSKMNYGIIKALETKSEYVRTAETLQKFIPGEGCPVDLDQTRVTLSDVAGLWIIWLCFLVMALITFLTSFLLKRCCQLNRTPFDQELRGKREDMIKKNLSAYFCGNILISLDILREHKNFLFENSRYCSEKLNLNPEILKQAQLLLNNDEEMVSLAFLSRTNREDSIIPISPKKTRLQSWISSIVPMTPKRSSDISSPSIIVLESPKNTPAFRKELNNAAKRVNKDSLVQFSKEKMNNFLIQFATRQTEAIAEKEVIIKAFSKLFELEPDPMRRRFVVPKVTSNAKWLEAFMPAPSKKKQPKNKLLSELLYLDYKTAFASGQPLVKSVESSIVGSLDDFEEKNKKEQEILRPQMVESLFHIRRQPEEKTSGQKMKRRILGSFGQSTKSMNLKMIDLNQKLSV